MLRATAISALALAAASAGAQELRFMCYSDGDECAVYGDLASRFEAENPGVTVAIDVVPYQTILEGLPVQLAADSGPDIATVTDLGGLSRYYLDLSPYVDGDYWAASFGDVLNWYRKGPDDAGIYGVHTGLTITGAYVNATLFEQAGVALPGPDATWDEWAAASRQAAEATETRFPMAIDRSGHRIAGPAVSFGAELYDGEDLVLVDDGFSAFAQKLVDWHADGTMARDVWVSVGGTTYQDAAQEFINGQTVFYYSGSWNTGRMERDVGDAFDWRVVGTPCGPAACSGMPGGSGMVGFAQTEHPAEVAAFLDFMAREEVYAEMTARNRSIPAHRAVAAAGVAYEGVSPSVNAALGAWGQQVGKISPINFRYQGDPNNRAMFGISVQRITQAMTGELSLEDAMARAKDDAAKALAEVAN